MSKKRSSINKSNQPPTKRIKSLHYRPKKPDPSKLSVAARFALKYFFNHFWDCFKSDPTKLSWITVETYGRSVPQLDSRVEKLNQNQILDALRSGYYELFLKGYLLGCGCPPTELNKVIRHLEYHNFYQKEISPK